VNIETQVETMARAIQSVFLKRGVPLQQHDLWYGSLFRRATKLHNYAVGDTVITITADPIEFSTWTKTNKGQVEREIQAEVAARLGIHGILGKEMSVTISEKNHSVVIQVSRPNPEVYGWGDIEQYSTGGIVLGRDILRQPILLDFERSVPGYLVTGASRSGKTNFLRAVIAQALVKNYEVYMAHLKPGGLRDYADLIPYIKTVAHDEDGANRLLLSIESRVVRRNRLEEGTEQRILFVWDEASEPFTPPEMGVRLGALAKGAGSSNVYLFVGVQNATKEVHKDVRYNLINRIAFRASPSMASHNSGLVESGIDKFKVGEALVITEGFSQRITTPRAEADDLRSYMGGVLKANEEIRKSWDAYGEGVARKIDAEIHEPYRQGKDWNEDRAEPHLTHNRWNSPEPVFEIAYKGTFLDDEGNPVVNGVYSRGYNRQVGREIDMLVAGTPPTVGYYLDTLPAGDRREVGWAIVWKHRFGADINFEEFKAVHKARTGSARVTPGRHKKIVQLAQSHGGTRYVLEDRRFTKSPTEVRWLREWSRVPA
jgi:hypothetical protein